MVYTRQDTVDWIFSSCHHKHQTSQVSWATFIMANRHLTLAETLRSVGHLSSCNVHPGGGPWTTYNHAVPVPSFSYNHILACDHCNACRMCWDRIFARITSSVAIRPVCNTSMAASMLQQASEYHCNESVRWRVQSAPSALHRWQSL